MPMTPAEIFAAGRRRRLRQYRNGKSPAPLACSLRARRMALGLSLHDVARACGLSITAVHNVEYGNDPRLTTCLKLARFFGCRVEDLWPAAADPEEK